MNRTPLGCLVFVLAVLALMAFAAFMKMHA